MEIVIKTPQQTEFDKAEYVRKPSGVIFLDGQEVAQTLTCVHCQYTWVPIKGSKRKRGWCTMCGGPTCGHHNCQTCIPFEKQLEREESKRRVEIALLGV